MQKCYKIEEIKMAVQKAKSEKHSVGFVPTMGALHKGHISLIEAAKKDCGFVIVSIFVNPTQFEPGSDFDRYPRTLENDFEICKAAGTDAVFVPSVEEMYQQQQLSWINVEKISELLCGASRKGHFKGVATVCAKLFNIIQADKAFFGQKDAQQLAVIKRMVSDLNIPLEIIGCPTIREIDGLAMSSRNKYLLPNERKAAPLIYASLQLAEVLIKGGETDITVIKQQVEKIISNSSLITPEYIEFVDPDTMESLTTVGKRTLIAIAANLGKARLIDNLLVSS